MILVTLGTQDKSFVRLLKAVQREIDKGNIKERVVVQAGFTKYKSNDMEIFDLIERDKFNDLIDTCDLLITHGGVGSIITGLKKGKKIIVCPRLSKYREHINDHQVQIVDNFYNNGYILAFNDGDDLGKIINKAQNFKPKKYISNTNNIVNLIKEYIDNN